MASDGEEEAAAAAGDVPEDEEAEEEAPRSGKKTLTAKKLAALQARYDARGVVYLSRLPPFMKPAKLRHLLQQHGDILRIYLAAEGASGAAEGATERRGVR
jgi:ESF2/ABP1 family protein